MSTVNKSEIKKLRTIAIKAAKNAYSPYSKAQVGCAIQTKNGNIYQGCNVENASYGATMCAERTAIFNAISHGEKDFETLYLYTKHGWPPCGMCRQVISEFAGPDLKLIIGSDKGEDRIYKLDELLPESFTSKDLNRPTSNRKR